MASGDEETEKGVLEDGYDSEDGSVEQTLETAEVPEWTKQLTPRAFIVSLILGIMFNFIIMRMSLTVGIIPSLNISAGLLAFFMLKSWIQAFERLGFSTVPFSRQENTIIQTCVIACVSAVHSGGFGSYLFAMSSNVADDFNEANDVKNIGSLGTGSTIIFMFLVSIVGLFIVAPIAKVMVVRKKLPYPSGVAIAHLINSFHTSQGAIIAKKQVWVLFKSLGGSFLIAGFKWMYAGGPFCGFSNFPMFGMTAFTNKFYFEFSLSNIGMGMICPNTINLSLLFGGVISHAFLWPHIRRKEGQWFPANLGPQDMHGLFGYKVFISLAMVVGDGLFLLIHVLLRTLNDLNNKRRQQGFIISDTTNDSNNDSSTNGKLSATNSDSDLEIVSQDEHRRTSLFLQDHISSPIAIGGYVLFAVISTIGIPFIFHQLQPYHVAVVYIIAPIFAFCNAYGAGLTNLSLGPSYGKVLIFIMGSWVGMRSGGVIAALASSGIIMPIVNYSSDLLQDYKTGYLTLSSPRAMLISQVFGAALGCVMGPLLYTIFERDPTLGDDGSEYPVPYAKLYRALALVGTEGFQALPDNCISLCIYFFFLAVIINVAKELAKKKNWEVHHYIPSVTGMAITFYLGPYVPISMCTGSLVVYLWGRVNKQQATTFTPALASGLMCGESLWLLPTLLMELNNVESPICMRFFSSETYNIIVSDPKYGLV